MEPNLVWTDTVLIPAGQTVDILLDVTNPAAGWLIATSQSKAEMMFNFEVDE